MKQEIIRFTKKEYCVVCVWGTGGLLIIIRAMIDEGGVQMSMRVQVTGLMSSKYVTLKFKKFLEFSYQKYLKTLYSQRP